MITISLCMIVRDEQAVLARCLDSIRAYVDEIIIVDTGSTDRTREIAQQYTDKVYEFTWINDFSAARNAAYERATMDYQMWLDADDVLPPEEGEKLLKLKQTLPAEIDIVTMKYHTHFDADGNPVLTSTRERLTRRSRGYRWQDPVHECIPLVGTLYHSVITISHKKPPSTTVPSTRNLTIYTDLEANGDSLTPRHQYYFARELKDHAQYAKAAYYFDRFLREGKGWQEDNIAACHALALCYKALKESEQILPALTRSFRYGGPRAEVLCEIGYYYKSKQEYRTALEWFHAAANLPEPDSMGFILQDYRGYIPNIECCVCCFALKQYQKAFEYNEAAAKCKPGNASVERNRAVLEPYLRREGAQTVDS